MEPDLGGINTRTYTVSAMVPMDFVVDRDYGIRCTQPHHIIFVIDEDVVNVPVEGSCGSSVDVSVNILRRAPYGKIPY